MIRKMEPPDLNQCASLLYSSGPRVLSYIFALPEPEILPLLAYFIRTPGNLFSQENIWVDAEAGEVRGLILALPAPAKKTGEAAMADQVPEIIRIAGWLSLLKMMFRGGISAHLDVEEADEFYISNLAVAEKSRGRGIASGLLLQAEYQARDLGYRKMSLVVESDNTTARRVYEKSGFTLERTIELPKKYHRHSLSGFQKMTKPV